MSSDHLNRLDSLLNDYQLDVLFCRLPENIVYLTGALPVLGISIAAYQPQKFTALLQPEFENIWYPNLNRQTDSFPTGHLGDAPITKSYAEWLARLHSQHKISPLRIGIEMDISITSPAFNASEMLLPGKTWQDLLQAEFPEARLVDAIPVLEQARAIKDEGEIALLQKSCEIANMGLSALQSTLHPGMSEVEAAALVESEIRVRGTGWKGARLVQAFAQVTTGPDGSYRQSMLTPSSTRKMERGDLVMIELGVCVDGYWSDLTRTYCVGKPDQAQIQAYNAVFEAQQCAVKSLQAGNRWGDPDQAARACLQSAGYGAYFKHGTGHGIGCRYHESIPRLNPGAEDLLENGMVTSVEPGIYIPGFGGIRIEDNLAVTEGGPLWLSIPAERW